jgi:cytochrome c
MVMTSRRRKCTSSRAFAIAAAATALAASADTGFAAADIQLGRYLAAECMTCHRAGTTTSTIPNIFGVPEVILVQVLTAYRDKRLANPVMQNIAGRLSDDDIASLALYFATTTKP